MNSNMRMPFSILCQPDIMQYNIFIYARIVSHERVSLIHFIERASVSVFYVRTKFIENLNR